MLVPTNLQLDAPPVYPRPPLHEEILPDDVILSPGDPPGLFSGENIVISIMVIVFST